jgi:hypothetical protein
MLLKAVEGGYRIMVSGIEDLKPGLVLTKNAVIDLVEGGFPVTISAYKTTIKLKKN